MLILKTYNNCVYDINVYYGRNCEIFCRKSIWTDEIKLYIIFDCCSYVEFKFWTHPQYLTAHIED